MSIIDVCIQSHDQHFRGAHKIEWCNILSLTWAIINDRVV